MKTLDPAFLAHLQGDVTTLAYCWRITRKDTQQYGFTSCDKDLVIGGLNYESTTGFAPTAARSSRELDVNNVQIDTWLERINDTDLQVGRFDGARVDVFVVNYNDLPASLTTSTKLLRLPSGYLGDAGQGDIRLTVEVRGLTQLLAQKIGIVTSPTCRYDLGNSKCKVVLTNYRFTGSITSITDRKHIGVSALNQGKNYYAGGILEFLTGANAGSKIEIAASTSGTLELFVAPPFVMAIGDSVRATAGCNKTPGGQAGTEKVLAKAITVVVDPVTFQSGVAGADGLYNGGTLTFTTGANVGKAFVVSTFTSTNGVIALGSTPAASIAVGDRFTLTKASTPTVGNGCLFFANIANYGGEPHVPGNDRALAGYDDNNGSSSGGTGSTTPGAGGGGGTGGGGGGKPIIE